MLFVDTKILLVIPDLSVSLCCFLDNFTIGASLLIVDWTSLINLLNMALTTLIEIN